MIEGGAILERGLRHLRADITLQQNIQLFHTPATPPQQAAAFRIQGTVRGSHFQDWRSTIIFLISAMARAGFRSFGQTSVQFMIV